MIKIDKSTLNNKTLFNIDSMGESVKRALKSALIEIGRESTRTARNFIINPPKTGRWYYNKNKRPKWHQASAAGQSPAKWTGNLGRNITYIVTSYVKAEIGVTVDYGKFLEEGTTAKPRGHRLGWRNRKQVMDNFEAHYGILPRPYLIRTVNKMKTPNMNIIKSHLAKALNK